METLDFLVHSPEKKARCRVSTTALHFIDVHLSAVVLLAQKPTVEVLYAANAEIGEGPFYEEETNQLIWVDISGKTVNLFDLKTKKNK